jgi:hypothetical protein
MGLRSKADRAIVAYLTPIVGAAATVYPANWSVARSLPSVTVVCRGGTGRPACGDSATFQVSVEIQGRAALEPGETDAEAPRVALDALVDLVNEALRQNDDATPELYRATCDLINEAAADKATASPTSNSDLTAFTCIQWLTVGYDGGMANEEGSAFMEKLNFTMLCAGSGGLLTS